jgi:hypothetical protein
MDLLRRLLLATTCLIVGFALWLPCIRLLYPAPTRDLAFVAEQHQRLSRPDPVGLSRLRRANPEWALMARTLAGAALARQILRARTSLPRAAAGQLEARLLPRLDALVERVLRLERQHGFQHFLLAYGRRGRWRQRPPRSQFVDGELAWLIGLRRRVRDDSPRLRRAFRQRVQAIVTRMKHSPTLSAESYPDECWTFCNTIALAALKLAERLDGADTAGLPQRWVALARRRLVDRRTGLLVSSYHLDGRVRDGPEGSSLWLSITMLRQVDRAFARDQYRRARRHLGRTVLGFGFAREWPAGARRARRDVDSGQPIPLLGASPSSSGFALWAARAFDDRSFARDLARSLELAGYPIKTAAGRRFAASNAVGDAVLLLAASESPLEES